MCGSDAPEGTIDSRYLSCLGETDLAGKILHFQCTRKDLEEEGGDVRNGELLGFLAVGLLEVVDLQDLGPQRSGFDQEVSAVHRFNSDVQSFRQPHIGYYVNSLYFVGGALAYKDILTMVNLTNGAVQREVMRLKGMNEREIMGKIQPIVLDQHQIGNPAVNYGVYLNGVLLPGILEMIVILITIYAVGSELKYGTSKHLLKTAGDSMVTALVGKLVPYNIIFTVLGITLEMLLFQWLKYPVKGSIFWMFLDILLLVSASEAMGLFIVELFPVLRLAISVGAIISVLGFSLAGFSLPVEAMPPYVQGFSAIFPLRHYYLFHVQETIWGSGFAGWWKEAVHLLLFLFLPFTLIGRLGHAYKYQDYERN